jgi:hypothetical protein
MSTSYDVSKEISDLEAQGKLVRYAPQRRVAKRRLYLCDQAVKDVTSPQSALAALAIQGRVRDVFERWTRGDRVWVDAAGKPRFIKPIFPPAPEVWEMLMIEPGAQVRIFFVFAEPDTIIASHARTRSFLGRKNSQNWIDAKNDCMTAWKKLFPHEPFKAASIHDYITENCDDFAI